MAKKRNYAKSQQNAISVGDLKKLFSPIILNAVSSSVSNSGQVAELVDEIFCSVYSMSGNDSLLFNAYLSTAIVNVVDAYKKTQDNKVKFEDLYNEFFPKVYVNLLNKLKRYCPNPDEVAYDMATDVIMKVYNKNSDVNYFKSYIYRATDNTFIDYTRRHATKYNVRMSDKFEVVSDSKTEVSNDLLLGFINKCEGLSDINKKIFIMKAVDDFTHREIAEKLNISESSSATRYHNTRQYLKTKATKVCL